MTHFVGGSGTSFTASGTTITSGSYSNPTSTATERVTVNGDEGARGRRPVTDWLRTKEARHYQHEWVLLADDFTVIDSASSPSELLARHPNEPAPTVVFVEADMRLAV